ncbi:hypothetical protein [Acuticoccus yangtzensis]|uniref:hypothetical protein n=1 Tax=Acuticoccus yangtzensis TaxID=1443441 RepID=UPI0009495A86|nr:hypothetical protein [Acuticoccus yangtzensis]
MVGHIAIQQAGEATPPFIRMVETGGTGPFVIGEGRVSVYHIGYSSVSDTLALVKAHRGTPIVILDRSTEAMEVTPKTTTMLLDAVPDGCRVIVLAQNHDYVRAVRALGDERLSAVFMHAFLRTLQWTFRRVDVEQIIARRKPDGPPGKLYTCLLNRPRPPKIAVFGWLKANGYLHLGHVSFRGDPAARDSGEMDAMIAKTRHQFPSFTREINAALKADWPHASFQEVEKESFIYSVNVPAYDAPVSLVVETEMAQNFERYTEKSLKVFMAGHRAVIAGNRGVAGLLKDIGFTLPGFSTAYDGIENQDARLTAALAEFERYLKFSPSERRDFIASTWEACVDNMRHFAERTERVMDASFEELAGLCVRSRWSAVTGDARRPVSWIRPRDTAA